MDEELAFNPQFSEVTPGTIDLLLTEIDRLVGRRPEYPFVGRTASFPEIFEGEPSNIFVHIRGVEKTKDGSIGGIWVYPLDAPKEKAEEVATKFVLKPLPEGMQLKKRLNVDTSHFEFNEEAPVFEDPPHPSPDVNGKVTWGQEYFAQLQANQKEVGYDKWEARRSAALDRYVDEQQAHDRELGLDKVSEGEGQELLRVLRAGTVESAPSRPGFFQQWSKVFRRLFGQ